MRNARELARRGPAGVLLAAVVAASSCSAPAPGSAPGPGATLIVGRPADAGGLDPARESAAESGEVCEQIYEHLVRFKPGTMEVEAQLATSWESNKEGTIWTFHLRPHVLFQDGTPFDADAVIFSFERQIDPRSPWHTGSFAWVSTYQNIIKLEKIDDLTVRFTIQSPFAPFLATLAMFPAAIVSPTAVRRWHGDLSRHPVGTGPFRFVDWAPGERITLERNPTYWGPPPRLDHLVFRTIRDARQRLIALEGGAVDVAYSIAPDDVQFVALHPDLQLLSVSANNVSYLALNTTHAPLDDVRVRQAINHAINRAAIVELLYQGRAQVANGVLPPTIWASTEDFHYDYSPDEARALLAAAGFKADPAHPLRLYAPDTERPYLPAPERMARVIADELSAVGIPTQVVVIQNFGDFLSRTGLGEHDLALLGWAGDDGDPDDFLYTLLDREQIAEGPQNNNKAFYQSAEVDGLLKYGQYEQTRARREALYERAEKVIAADAPWVPIAHSEWTIAATVAVHDLALSPASMVYYGSAWKE